MNKPQSKNEHGSVTVEASIALTAFLFVFVTIYGLITVCRAQANIQVAINSAAREISQYSYLYGMTGLDKAINGTREAGAADAEKGKTFIGQVADVFGEIQGLAGEAKSMDITSWDSVSTVAAGAKDLTDSESVKAVWQSLKSAAKDPKAILFGMGRIMAAGAWDIGMSQLIAAPISRLITEKNLRRSATDTADAFCKSLRIVPGSYLGNESYFNGLDFTHSELFPVGADNKVTDEILIVVTYKVKLLPLLPIKAEFSVTQIAQTRGWLHGDGGEIPE